MDSGQSIQTLSIGKKKGWYLSRNVAVTLLVLFMGALLGAGLVYYYGTQFVARDATPVEASSTDFASAGISGVSFPIPSSGNISTSQIFCIYVLRFTIITPSLFSKTQFRILLKNENLCFQ